MPPGRQLLDAAAPGLRWMRDPTRGGALCSIAYRQKIFFLWRPSLPDPKDDMVLELAVASRARYIVTFNKKHFAAAGRFGIQVLTPRAFLDVIGG